MALSETARLVADLELQDHMSGPAGRAKSSLGGLNSAVSGVQKSLGQAGKGVGQVGAGLLRIGTVAATVAAGGLVVSAKAAANFGDQMNVINTIAQVTPDKLTAIGDGIRQLSRDTGADLTDLTGSYYDLLSAGIKVGDAQNALNLSFKLSRGSLSTTGEAVDFLTTAINSYKLTQQGTTQAADMFAQAVADGKVKLSEISATFANVAPIAKTAGVGLNEIAASYGLLTAKGNTAAATTTQMNRAIIELLKPNADLLKLQDKLHHGNTTFYQDLMSSQGLVPALQQLRMDAQKAGVPFQDLFGRLEGYKFALATTGPNNKDFQRELDNINNSAGALNKQFDQRQQGLAYQFQRLKANALDAAISIGQGLAPSIGRLADKATLFLQEHRQDLIRFGQDIGKAIDGINWDAVEKGGETFLTVIGKIYDLIKLIPPQVDAAVLSFMGLNKLSGGLLGQGIGNIVGGLGGALVKGLASKIPGLGSLVATPVYVTNWPMGGLGGLGGAGGGTSLLGRIGTAVSIIGAVSIAGASIAALAVAFGQFMDSNAQAQADLQQKSDAAAKQTGQESITNLKNLSAKLDGLQGIDRIIADTWGSKESATALVNLADNIASDKRLNNADLVVGLQTLREAQATAISHGWTAAADSIGLDINAVVAAVQSQPAPTAAEIGAAVASHTEPQISQLQDKLTSMWSPHGAAATKSDGLHNLTEEQKAAMRARYAEGGLGGDIDKRGSTWSIHIGKALGPWADKITRGATGNAHDIRAAIRQLQEKQSQVTARGNQQVASHIGRDITTLQARLSGNQQKQTGVLQTIADKPTDITVNTTTNVSTSVSVRDVQSGSHVTSRYGMVAI